MKRQPTRREFLRWSAGGAAALGIGMRAGRAMAQAGGSAASRVAASERVTLGFIGIGDKGRGLMNEFMALPDIQVAACADVDKTHLAQGIAKTDGKAVGYEDYRSILDRKDIDAVVIATPDHWHALATVHACDAGKDVYGEKPLAHNVREGQLMVEAARRKNRITQMGTQIHAGENYRRMVELVQSGELGPITTARVWLFGNGYPEGRGRFPDASPPAELNYDRWLGPAPWRPYNQGRSHWNWRYYWDYANGVLGDFGCHLMDLVYWAMNLDAPRSVAAVGGKYIMPDQTETPDTLEVIYEFEPAPGRDHKFSLIWSNANTTSQGFYGREMGIAFYGANATLVGDYNTHEILVEKKRREPIKAPPKSIPPSPGHQREFIDCVKSRQRCSCHIERSHKLTNLTHLGNISMRVGRRLTWDGAAERFVGDDDANKLLRREYRKPYVL